MVKRVLKYVCVNEKYGAQVETTIDDLRHFCHEMGWLVVLSEQSRHGIQVIVDEIDDEIIAVQKGYEHEIPM